MAKGSTGTTKKKSGTTPHSAGAGNILSFFSKSPATSTSTSTANAVATSRVKVEEQETPSRNGSWKGKGKAVYGNEDDPVVISDDEDSLPPAAPMANSNGRRKRSPSPIFPVVDAEGGSVAGPSRPPSPARSCSPPPPAIDEATRPVIASNPAWKPPETWPTIINTADLPSTEDDEHDDDSVVGREDHHDEDTHSSDEPTSTKRGVEDGENRCEPIDMVDSDDEEVMEIIPSGEAHLGLSGRLEEQMGGLDMEWDEGDDEGMGMEEEGEDLEERSVKKTRGGSSSSSARSGASAACPICGMSLKGKSSTAAEKHINTCLDKTSSRKRTNRPISSFDNFASQPSDSPPPEEPTKGPNAFSVLMSGHKEKDQWRDAEEDLRRDGKRFFGRRKAPFYKVLTGMPVAVDAFRYGGIPKVTAYLLTHAHSDHYTNLSKSWNHGPIYCSQTTANLIVHMLGVEPQWVHGLPDNEPFEMPNTGGVTVTPIEANHCPGSSIFLFEGLQTINAGDSGFRSPYVGSKKVFRYLHCGDFRACPKMVLHPAIARARIDTCYLDTTYLNPKYCFPPQTQVMDACAVLARKLAVGLPDNAPALEIKPQIKFELPVDIKPDINQVRQDEQERAQVMMKGWLKREDDDPAVKVEVKEEKLVPVGEEDRGWKRKRTLIVMGTYSIGKERIVKTVAKAIGSKIYCDPRKRAILMCQTDPELHSMMSDDPIESQIHLVPLGNIQLDRLQPYLARLHPHFDRVLGFRPTGWTYTPPAGTNMAPDVNTIIKRDQARYFTDASLKPMRGSCRDFMMYGVPYSEHSSFFELTCFALSMPGPEVKMIATVNVGNENSRMKMKKWFEKWAAEKAKRKEKGLPAVVDYRDVNYW